MAKIPVIKLNNGTTNYFPVSVLNSVFLNKEFEVKNTVGGLRSGTILPVNTSLEAIMGFILQNDADDIEQRLNEKVDKVEGKGLSSENFTSAYKTKLDELDSLLNAKVDTAEGCRLIRAAEIEKLDNLENYNDEPLREYVNEELSKKITITEGMGLSKNDYSDDDKAIVDDFSDDSRCATVLSIISSMSDEQKAELRAIINGEISVSEPEPETPAEPSPEE